MKTPYKAFILAAGLGTRLRPYTNARPKPMVEVAGRSLITRTLDKLLATGVHDVTVNLHYLADVLRDHLEHYRRGKDLILHYSHEPTLQGTGGGIRKTIEHFGNAPFYVIAGDALWGDAPGENALLELARCWDNKTMDILTLLQPLENMALTGGTGDYDMKNGRPVRSIDKSGAYMWTNIRLNHPRIFDGFPEGDFSFLPLMDAAEKTGRLHALVHKGAWHHISTPGDLERVEAAFRREENEV